jgi:hypothetical protein
VPCLLALDEWVIGTMLRGRFPLHDRSDGVCIVQQNFLQKSCAKCEKVMVTHFCCVVVSWSVGGKRHGKNDSTFVLRKVPVTKNV